MNKFFKKYFLSITILSLVLFSFPFISSALTVCRVESGCTGIGTLTGIPYGTGTSPFSTVTIGSGLSFSGGTLSASGGGNVIGPASATDGNFVEFDGTTGKLIKNSAYNPSSFIPSANQYWDRDSLNGYLYEHTLSDKVGIGLNNPHAMQEILSSTEQLRLSYDASHYSSLTVGSGGSLTLSGTTGYLTASKLITSGGTSSQFVKGDGSLDSTTYSTFTNPMTTLGDIIFENATPAPDRLAGNTSTVQKFLSQTGDGVNSAPPSWQVPINLVPYSGATQDVDLGTHQITTANITDTGLSASQALMTDVNKKLISVDYLDQAVKTTSSPTFAGALTINSGTGGVNKGITFNLQSANANSALRYLSFDFNSYTSGLVGQFFMTGNTYDSGGAIDLPANSVGLFSELLNGSLILGSGGANGDIRFITGGYAIANERARILKTGELLVGGTADNASGAKLQVTGGISSSTLTASNVVFTDANKKLVSTGIGTSSQFIKGDGSLDSSTYLTSLSGAFLLDQTSPQTIINGTPTFNVGLNIKTGSTINWNTSPILSVDITNRNFGFGYGITLGSSDNVALGYNAMHTGPSTSGGGNTAFGTNALYYLTTGNNNNAVGSGSLQNNTTGNFNVGVGSTSLFSNNTGRYNAGIGYYSLEANTTGYQNVGVGGYSLQQVVGDHNTGIGYNAGGNITTGTEGIYIGYSSAGKNATGDTNEIVIGSNLTGNGSHTTTIGNSSNTDNYFTGNMYVGTTKLAITTKGSSTLTAGTTTTVTDANAKTTSVIILQATSLGFTALQPYISTKSAGSFVITTLTAAGTETFDYEILN